MTSLEFGLSLMFCTWNMMWVSCYWSVDKSNNLSSRQIRVRSVQFIDIASPGSRILMEPRGRFYSCREPALNMFLARGLWKKYTRWLPSFVLNQTLTTLFFKHCEALVETLSQASEELKAREGGREEGLRISGIDDIEIYSVEEGSEGSVEVSTISGNTY